MAAACPGIAQVVFNEIAPDPGNYDGYGGEWIEIYNAGTQQVDLGCWRITNGGSFVVSIPSGVHLPPGGYLLVGGVQKMACASCDFAALDTRFTFTNGIGIGHSSPYSNTIWLNTDPVSLGGTGLLSGSGALNNANKGDRLILFDNNGNIQDAFMYGGGNYYGNGELIVVAPASATCPVKELIVPAVGQAAYSNGKSVCNTLVSCISSYARLPNGNHNGTVTWDQSGQISNLDNATCTNGESNTASTDFPTPGLANNAVKLNWVLPEPPVIISPGDPFAGNPTVALSCQNNVLEFKFEVYNYLHIEALLNRPDGKLGSYITNLQGKLFAWESGLSGSGISFDALTGTTSLVYRFMPGDTANQYNFVLGKFNREQCSCPGSTSSLAPFSNSNTARDCYFGESVKFAKVNPPTSATITCTDPLNGITKVELDVPNLLQLPGGNQVISRFNLFDGVNLVASNNTGVFAITRPADDVYAVEVTGLCLPTPITAVGTICLAPQEEPPCPSITNSVINNQGSGTSMAERTITLCPGDNLSLFATGTNLPKGAFINWLYSEDPNFDPSQFNPNDPAANNIYSFQQSEIRDPGSGICPQVIAALINAPNRPLANGFGNVCSGNVEGQNEFTVLKTGSQPLNYLELVLTKTAIDGSGPRIFYNGALDITSTPRGQLIVERLNASVGSCGANAVFIPATGPIPANSKVVVVYGTLNYQFNWGSLCGQTIYVLVSSFDPKNGFYVNTSGNRIISSITSCSSCTITHDVEISSATEDGAYALFDGINSASIITTVINQNLICGNTSEIGLPVISADATPQFNPGGCGVSVVSTAGGKFNVECGPSRTYFIKGTISGANIAPDCNLTEYTTPNFTVKVKTCPIFTIRGGNTCSSTEVPITLSSSEKIAPGYKVFVTLFGQPVPGSPFILEELAANQEITLFNSTVSGVYEFQLSPPLFDDGVEGPVSDGTTCSGTFTRSVEVNIEPPAFIGATTNFRVSCAGIPFDLNNIVNTLNASPPLGELLWYTISGTTPNVIFTPLGTSVTMLTEGEQSFGVTTATGTDFEDKLCISEPIAVVSFLGVPTPSIENITCTFNRINITASCENCTIEYSLDGANWDRDPSFLFTEQSFEQFARPGNTTVYARNAASPQCIASLSLEDAAGCQSILPLQKFSLDATLNQGVAYLNWQFKTNLEGGYFVVEKSDDGQHFFTIGKLKAGNGTYQFVDNKFRLSAYYRVQFVDASGGTTLSPIKWLLAKQRAPLITAGPNPFSNSVQLFSGEMLSAQQLQLKIIAPDGRLIGTNRGSLQILNRYLADLSSHWLPGIYLLRLESSNYLSTLKVIKSK